MLLGAALRGQIVDSISAGPNAIVNEFCIGRNLILFPGLRTVILQFYCKIRLDVSRKPEPAIQGPLFRDLCCL